MIQVENNRGVHRYLAMQGPYVWYVTLSRTGEVVPDGGPPGDVIPDDIAAAVAAFVMEEAQADGEARH